MRAAFLAVTGVAAVVYGYAAFLNVTHDAAVTRTAERLGVPSSWMVRLGSLLAAGSIGLVAGLAVPALGTAAACGLVLYFACAAGFHVRARDTQLLSWVTWASFFLLAVAVLVVGLAHRGPW